MPRAIRRSSSSDSLSSVRAVVSSSASAGHAVLDQAQQDGERDQPLLRAVVQVALELAAGGVAGLDDPRSRRAQVGQPGAQVGLQALVLERDPGRGRDRADELGLVLQRGVVDQRGDGRAAALDERGDAAGACGRQLDRLTVDADVASGTRAPSRPARARGRAARGRASPAAHPARRARAGRPAARRSRSARAARAAARRGRSSGPRRAPASRSRRAPASRGRACPAGRRRSTCARPAAPASTGISARRSGALACRQRRTSTIAERAERGDQDHPLERVDRVGQPGLVGHHQDVPRHARLAEESKSRTSATAPRAGSSRSPARRSARGRSARRGARAGSRPAGTPVAAATGLRARCRRSAAPAPSIGAAAARRTRRARSRASARRPGSPAVASRPPRRWP